MNAQSLISQNVVINGVVTPVNLGVPTGIPGINAADVVLAGSVFRYDSATVNLNYTRPRTEFGVSWSEGRARSPYPAYSSTVDRNTADGALNFARRLTPAISLTVQATYDKYDPLTSGVVGQTVKAEQVGLRWQTGSQLQLQMFVEHENWDSTAVGASFTDNVVYVGVVYGPPRHFRPALAPSAIGRPQAPAAGY